MEGSDQEAITGGGEQSQERRDQWWKRAIAGRGQRRQVEESEGERQQGEGSDCRWRGAIAGGGEQSQVEGSDSRRRGAITGGRVLSQVEGRLLGEVLSYLFIHIITVFVITLLILISTSVIITQ